MKNENIAVVRAVVVRNTEDWGYIPVQISVIRYENGRQIKVYDSMINPMCNISGCLNMPEHLNAQILESAPSPYVVAKQVKELVSGCEIDMDEMSLDFLSKS